MTGGGDVAGPAVCRGAGQTVRVNTGEEWAYRLRDNAPSEHVCVLAIYEGKRANRVDLLFLDDPDERI